MTNKVDDLEYRGDDWQWKTHQKEYRSTTCE